MVILRAKYQSTDYNLYFTIKTFFIKVIIIYYHYLSLNRVIIHFIIPINAIVI